MIISAVIVTYNRKKDLLRCLSAVLSQTQEVTNLVIINNCSTDGTKEEIQDYFHSPCPDELDSLIKLCENDQSQIYIVNKSQNTGGAGGFHEGLRIAHENLRSDFVWMMDDDGYPEENCLKSLLQVSLTNGFDYIMPASIDIDNHQKLSWPVRKKNGKKTDDYADLMQSWGSYLNYVTPFNGVLLSKRCVDTVGYINEQFFIWGDEYDHYWRCMKAGFKPVTLLSAKFYHPSQKLPLVKICLGLFRIPYIDSPLRMICLARNYTYIYRHYGQWYKIPVKFLLYTWLFLVFRHFDFQGWKLYILSVKDGFREDFSRHLQYLK